MLRRMKICSVVPFPALNLACSSRRCLSTSLEIRLMMIFTMSGISVMPLQFPQQVRSPFFASFIINPFLQSDGTFSLIHTRSKILDISSVEVYRSVLRSSADMLSIPGAFLFFMFLKAHLISSLVAVLHQHQTLLFGCYQSLLVPMDLAYSALHKSVLSIFLSYRSHLLAPSHSNLSHCLFA